MAVATGNLISRSDLEALVTSANTKLDPHDLHGTAVPYNISTTPPAWSALDTYIQHDHVSHAGKLWTCTCAHGPASTYYFAPFLSPVEPGTEDVSIPHDIEDRYFWSEGILRYEMDRIRSDWLDHIFGDDTSPVYKSADALVSSPHVIGLNPCPNADGRLYLGIPRHREVHGPWETGKAFGFYQPGSIVRHSGSAWTCLLANPTGGPVDQEPGVAATYWRAGVFHPYFPLFKDVEFWHAPYQTPKLLDNDVDVQDDDMDFMDDGSYPVTIYHKLEFTWSTSLSVGGAFDQTFSVIDATRCYVRVEIPLSGGSGEPALGLFTYNLTAGTGYHTIQPDGAGWKIVAHAWLDLAAGESSVTFTFGTTSPWVLGAVATKTQFTLQKSQTIADAEVIHPGATGKKVSITNFDPDQTIQYQVNKADIVAALAVDFLEIKPTQTRGCWVAKSLPQPAINNFLDPDFPPYVRELRQCNNKDIATVGSTYMEGYAPSSLLTIDNPRSSMRQPAPHDPLLGAYEAAFETPTISTGTHISRTLQFPWWLYPPTNPNYGSPYVNALLLTEALDIYFSTTNAIDPADAGTYEYHPATPVDIITIAELVAQFGNAHRQLFYVVQNAGGSPVTVDIISQDYTHEPEVYYAVEPSISSLPALWLVIRDTDAYPTFISGARDPNNNDDPLATGLDPYRGVVDIGTDTIPDGAGVSDSWLALEVEAYFDFLLSSSPPLKLYVSSTIPNPGPGTEDFIKTDGILTMADIITHYGPGPDTPVTIYFQFINDTGLQVVCTRTLQIEWVLDIATHTRAPRLPVFFPSNMVEETPADHYTSGMVESFSKKLRGTSFVALDAGGVTTHGEIQDAEFLQRRTIPNDPDSASDTLLDASAATGEFQTIPHRGYCIYSVMVRRKPVLTAQLNPLGRTIYMPPTAAEDLTELVVSIGQFIGVTHTEFEAVDKGTFTELASVTIPAGELQARVSVFWPVCQGAPLVYQATAEVFVEALVNYQPAFHFAQYAGRGKNDLSSRFDGMAFNPFPFVTVGGLKQRNNFDLGQTSPDIVTNTVSNTQFQPGADWFNDLEAALNIL